MGDVINFGDTKAMRLERELARTQDELAQTRAQLLEAQKAVGSLSTVNDMLKLQIVSLINDLTGVAGTATQTIANLKALQSKLPDIQA